MSKHTPGPWKAVPNGCGKCAVRTEDGVWLTYKAGSDHAPTETLEANARLIAAAPELLSVLKELEESAEYWSEYFVPCGIVDRIRAAIAKATGETP